MRCGVERSAGGCSVGCGIWWRDGVRNMYDDLLRLTPAFCDAFVRVTPTFCDGSVRAPLAQSEPFSFIAFKHEFEVIFSLKTPKNP